MIRASIGRPVAVSMVYLAIAVLGIAAARNMPIELLPDTSLPRLTVQATWPGSSPEVVEAFLTSPIEAAIQQVRGVEKISSTSREGNASIDVTFARETDMDFARLELSERLGSLEGELPVGARPPLVQMYVPEEFKDQQSPILVYQISGPYLLEYLRQQMDDRVVPELLDTEGVGSVRVDGGRARVLEIELSEEKIQALGLRLADIATRIMELEIVREAGVVFDDGGLLRALAVRQRPESADEIRKAPVLVDRGRIVRVDDVARVYDTFEEPTTYARVNGFPAVTIRVFKGFRTNTVVMAERVKELMTALEAQVAPGIRMRMVSDQSEQIRKQLSDLRNRAAISAAIVLLVLLLFLRSWRAAFIVFATVAFAVLITINIIYFGGLTLNLLTLMGLAMGFGLIVDNAIVVLENIYRRRRGGEAAVIAAEHGTKEVVLAILAATGTTVVVLIPFVYLQGDLRIYYMPLAIVVGLSLVASLFVAFTFIPSLGAKLLGRTRPDSDALAVPHEAGRPGILLLPPPRSSRAVRLYGGMIRGTLHHPWITVALVLLLLGGSYYLFNKYVSRGRLWGGGWGGQSSYISIQIQQQRGEELDQTDALARFFEERLKAMPEVERFETTVYAERGAILVYFPDEYENTDVPVAIKEQLYQYSLGWGGADVRVYGYGPSFYGGGGSPPNYTIQVLGYNYEHVRDIAEGVGERLKRFSRVRDVDTNSSGRYVRDKATELVLDVDRGRLALHDLSAADVVAQVSAAVRGQTQDRTLVVGGEERQFSLKLDGYQNMDMHRLDELLIPAPTGEALRLGTVAALRERNVLHTVRRENQQYERSVSYEFRGPPKLGDRTRDQVVKATFLPAGYSIKATQEFTWSVEEKKQIYGVLALSVFLIFMVTAAVFESLRLPLCVLLTVPLALIGVFLLFFYTGASFTREAYVGVIMMGGIVVNNSILLVDHVNQLRRVHGLPLQQALERGTLERVRPIMMTSLTTICGLLPLVLFSETADANIWNALAYALIGGLSSSTILVLTVTPALYLLFERRAETRRLAAADAPARVDRTAVPV